MIEKIENGIQAGAAGDIPFLKECLQTKNWNVNEKDLDERTALHWAAGNGHVEMVTFLLQLDDIDINGKDEDGWTPVMIATSSGYVDSIRALVDHGANVNLCNNNGQIPLHYHKGRMDVVEELIHVTKNIDHEDQYGVTPLMRAIEGKGNADVVQLLVQHGAQVNHCDRQGKSMAQLAWAEKQLNIIQVLIDNGATPPSS